jgi:pilus assembly protein CpaF
MRPDRVVIGECRGGETLDMLQAMNTGHEGSLTTIHANDTREALSRLEMMSAMGAGDLPIWILRRQIVSAVDLIVQTARLRGGPRKIMRVSEVTGMEGDTISMQDIFLFRQTGIDENDVAVGHFECTGIRPKAMDRLEANGVRMSPSIFDRRIIEM